MADKILVCGSRGSLLVTFNGKELDSGVNVFEAFMLLAGLCRNKAQLVQVKIQEPENPGLEYFFRRGLDVRKTIENDRVEVLRKTEMRIADLEEKIESQTARVADCLHELDVAKALKARLSKKVKKSSRK